MSKPGAGARSAQDVSEKQSESGDSRMGDDSTFVDGSSMDDSSLKTGEYYVDEDEETEITADESVHTFAPRKSGFEIAPGIQRIVSTDDKSTFMTSVKLFQSLLKRHRVPQVEKHIEHLVHFDRSDKLIPHGEISKAIYQGIYETRNFDVYARPLYLSDDKLKEHKEKLKKFLMGKKYRYTRPPSESEAIRKAAYPVFDHDVPQKKQPITTAVWKVGMKNKYKAPVGFAPAPGELLNSEGRESYYSYDGEWKNGKMHGEGTYLFTDGETYKGYWKDNLHDGQGVALYPIGSEYKGEWKKGKFHGEGVLECNGGTRYEGNWKAGKRWGKGTLRLPSGLEYEGEWVDGVPHGRGRMESKLTGYVYEGSFERGSIEGSGVLYTPPPNSERIVRFWPRGKDGMTLAGVIRMLNKERKDFYDTQNRNREIMFGPKRKLFLDDYVQEVRTNLHEQRAIEKREKLNAQIAAIKEQKEKLREAKLRALVGDAEDDGGGGPPQEEYDDDDDDMSDMS